jgi:hypothetical protein
MRLILIYVRSVLDIFEIPQCVGICPIDCIPKDESYVETNDQLYQKYLQLTKKEPK